MNDPLLHDDLDDLVRRLMVVKMRFRHMGQRFDGFFGPLSIKLVEHYEKLVKSEREIFIAARKARQKAARTAKKLSYGVRPVAINI